MKIYFKAKMKMAHSRRSDEERKEKLARLNIKPPPLEEAKRGGGRG